MLKPLKRSYKKLKSIIRRKVFKPRETAASISPEHTQNHYLNSHKFPLASSISDEQTVENVEIRLNGNNDDSEDFNSKVVGGVSSSESDLNNLNFTIKSIKTDELQNHPSSAIDSTHFSLKGIKISYLSQFINENGGRTALEGKATTTVNETIIKPTTAAIKDSMCEYLLKLKRAESVGTATWFISHAWSCEFLHVVDSILEFFEKDQPGEDVTENPIPLTRAWCVFELYACTHTKSRFEIGMPQAEKERFLNDVRENTHRYFKMLSKVKSENSNAFKNEDKNAIQRHKKRSRVQELRRIGLEKEFLCEWIFALARLHQQQGDLDDAEGLYLECLEVAKEAFGELHPNSLSSVNNLALLYESRGKYDLAEPLLVKCLEGKKCVMGVDDPSTFTTMNNLGKLYISLGKYDVAEPLLLDCFNRRVRVLGKEHPATLISLNNLGFLYQSQGLNDLAEPLYQYCLDYRKQVLGVDHPDTFTSMNNLAGIYESQQKYDLAESLYLDCLDQMQRVLGKDYPTTLTSISNLAFFYQNQRKYELAEPLFLDCLALRRRVLGEEHPETLTSMYNLAKLYELQGKYDLAESMHLDCLSERKRIFGDDHLATLASISNLAALYKTLGRYDQAEQLLTNCVERRKRKFGMVDLGTFRDVGALVEIYKLQGKIDLLMNLFAEFFSNIDPLLLEEILSEESIEVSS